MTMRVVFMGSAPLSCPSLEALASREDVVGVVTQPDRPQGRSLRVCPGIVRAGAESNGLRVLTPADVNAAGRVAAISALRPDLVVVIAYGQILRDALLALPPLGCVNVHTSLLPGYRGAAPIQRALANGETETGVTTLYMDRGMDTGDIILQRATPIGPDDTCAGLHERLARLAAELLVETVDLIARGAAPRTPQDSTQATVAPRLKKRDGRIDWTLPAAAIANRVRGFNPWPGTFTQVPDGHRLKVLAAAAEPAESPAVAGTVLAADSDGLLVACGEGALRLLDVQPEAGKVMAGAAYVRGHDMRAGTRLE